MSHPYNIPKEICWRCCCPPVCLFCIPPFFPCVVSNLAFFPPNPTYSFGPPKQTSVNNDYIQRETFTLQTINPQYTDSELDAIDMFTTQTSRGNRIACVYVRVLPTTTRFTILYSHGNACDLGQICKYYVVLAAMINCNILSYDYSGYGVSTGRPSEQNIYSDIEAALFALQLRYGVNSESVILLGDSIGTVPTVHLASSLHRKFAAVVLNAPLTSGMRVMFSQPHCNCCFDVFDSINKVSRVNSPILIIHGTEDRTIRFAHGIALYERCRNPLTPLWMKGSGHSVQAHPEYYDRLVHLINVDLAPKTKPLKYRGVNEHHVPMTGLRPAKIAQHFAEADHIIARPKPKKNDDSDHFDLTVKLGPKPHETIQSDFLNVDLTQKPEQTIVSVPLKVYFDQKIQETLKFDHLELKIHLSHKTQENTNSGRPNVDLVAERQKNSGF